MSSAGSPRHAAREGDSCVNFPFRTTLKWAVEGSEGGGGGLHPPSPQWALGCGYPAEGPHLRPGLAASVSRWLGAAVGQHTFVGRRLPFACWHLGRNRGDCLSCQPPAPTASGGEVRQAGEGELGRAPTVFTTAMFCPCSPPPSPEVSPRECHLSHPLVVGPEVSCIA